MVANILNVPLYCPKEKEKENKIKKKENKIKINC